MNIDLSLINLVKEASVVVQLVMLVLLITSIISWMFIFTKGLQLSYAIRLTTRFEKKVWKEPDLNEIYQRLSTKNYRAKGLEKIFLKGYQEFDEMRQQSNGKPAIWVENAHRAMRIELTRELDRLDQSLPFLATVGSTSPYVGLFGTVWGIMNAFRSLVNVQQATLTQVAPGIAEALIATAIGLFVAIPAVIFYNRFSTRVERIAVRHEIFIDECVIRLQKLAREK